jgi:DNA repair exonuclease SbcCD ATPase subunit
MPFVYVPLKTFPLSLEEAKKELEKISECYKNLERKDFDPIAWFENDLKKDLKSLETISEKISCFSKDGGKILGRLEYIKREVKELEEKRTELILGDYKVFYSSKTKEIFTSFSDFLTYLVSVLQELRG